MLGAGDWEGVDICKYLTQQGECQGQTALQYESHVEDEEWEDPGNLALCDPVDCHDVDAETDQHGQADGDDCAEIHDFHIIFFKLQDVDVDVKSNVLIKYKKIKMKFCH